jgi:hypothetical protein
VELLLLRLLLLRLMLLPEAVRHCSSAVLLAEHALLLGQLQFKKEAELELLRGPQQHSNDTDGPATVADDCALRTTKTATCDGTVQCYFSWYACIGSPCFMQLAGLARQSKPSPDTAALALHKAPSCACKRNQQPAHG